jgi:subtilisin family serine protease
MSGEIIVRLSPQGRDKVSVAVPFTGDVERGVVEPVEDLGVARIQEVFARRGCQIYSVTRPLMPMKYATALEMGFGSSASLMMEEFWEEEVASGLADLYVLKTDEDANLDLLCSELVGDGGDVDAAVPRFPRFTLGQPSDLLYFHQWGPWRIRCEEAWEGQTGSEDVIVAIVDSGVDPEHLDLRPNLLNGSDQVTSKVQGVLRPGWHFAPDPPTRTDNSAHDDDGHGTHVAGIVGARGNDGRGVAGVVWQCKLLPVRCLAHIVKDDNSQDTSIGHPDDIASAIKWAADHGAHVINLSLGGRGRRLPGNAFMGDLAEESAVRYAQSRGCLVIAAAGNDGTREPNCPASFAGVIGVGAVDWEDRRASFSNWDKQSVITPTAPQSSVDVVAPGVNILSTAPGGKFASMSGTSQATPHVSGVAAMLFSERPRATAQQVAEAICKTADPLAESGRWHPYYGYGRVNARRALDEIAAVVPP